MKNLISKKGAVAPFLFKIIILKFHQQDIEYEY